MISVGELQIASRYISVDSYVRINQSVKPTYNKLPHPLNVVQSAGGVGEVIASNAPNFAVGDGVEGMLCWQTHAVMHHNTFCRLDPTHAPVSTALGVLGMPGCTAWFGLTESEKPKAGEVVVVSGAAAALGLLVA